LMVLRKHFLFLSILLNIVVETRSFSFLFFFCNYAKVFTVIFERKYYFYSVRMHPYYLL